MRQFGPYMFAEDPYLVARAVARRERPPAAILVTVADGQGTFSLVMRPYTAEDGLQVTAYIEAPKARSASRYLPVRDEAEFLFGLGQIAGELALLLAIRSVDNFQPFGDLELHLAPRS